jgi:hypothetical protein
VQLEQLAGAGAAPGRGRAKQAARSTTLYAPAFTRSTGRQWTDEQLFNDNGFQCIICWGFQLGQNGFLEPTLRDAILYLKSLRQRQADDEANEDFILTDPAPGEGAVEEPGSSEEDRDDGEGDFV